MNIIMHIDVNNAFLSWTAIYLLNHGSKYDIRNSYAVIGGDEKKRSGIVLAKSTPAKKLGIKTGETLYSARKKCKVLKTYPPNFEFYQEMSKKMFKLISKYTPDIEIASIDECYLDYTKIMKLYGNQMEFAQKLQKEIYDTLGFTVNIGIANNKLCAKMASDFTKPYKIHTLYDNEIKEKMWPLEVGELFGIGKKTVPKLNKLGIKTIEDLAKYNEHILYKYFKNQANNMISSAKGIDNSIVTNKKEEPKGIGNEITLNHDIKDKEKLYEYLLTLSEKVGLRLRNENKYANVVTVILKDNTFRKYSHQKKLENSTNDSNKIFNFSKIILNEIYKDEPIRLIGIRLEKLTKQKITQVSLFDIKEEPQEDISKLIDSINTKYGNSAIKKASLLNYNKTKK
ncbi:MAG: DNA polymerase IV [Bacilli bacterium]|nr:DNA polymerase IV [Bacilli bacterium]